MAETSADTAREELDAQLLKVQKRLYSEISWALDTAINDLYDNLYRHADRNKIPHDQVTQALQSYGPIDLDDGWLEYIADG